MFFRCYVTKAVIISISVTVFLLIIPEQIIATDQTRVDWCQEHRVPESVCTKCNPGLRESFKTINDWCRGCDLPESHCYVCNPEIEFPQELEFKNWAANSAKKKTTPAVDWCAEHRVPESECTKCNPGLRDTFKAKNDWCRGCDLPESHCYVCNPDIKFPQELDFKKRNGVTSKQREGKPQTSIFRSNKQLCATDDAVINFASSESGLRVGLEFATVVEIETADHVEAPGKIQFSPTSTTIVPCLIKGTLVQWIASPGQQLLKNQIIAKIESIEAASLCSDYLQSRAILNLHETNLERKRELSTIGLISEREVLDAETETVKSRISFRKAKSALLLIGYSEEDVVNLGESGFKNTLISVRSPQPGKLIDYLAELGSIIEAGQPLAHVADVNEIEVIAQFRESDIPRIRIGQTAIISSDGNSLQRESGEVVWISDVTDPVTHSVPVRIRVLKNSSNIRFQQFVQVSIEIEEPQHRALVPESAVQWDGCCNVVFIAETPDRLRPRKITVEYADQGGYIVTGIDPGAQIATKGSYLLKTEMMKEGIGAGCCPVGT